MSQERWITYLTHRIARLRKRIEQTERLMRPPTPEELVALRQELELLKAREAKLTRMLTDAPSDG
jgi:hypothetical protein